jgi:hypothetical protein
MKTLTALAFAAIGIGLSPFAIAKAEDASSSTTETALACLLGMAPDGCERGFMGFTYGLNNLPLSRYQVRRLITYCSKRYVHRRLDNCYSGPLESVKYLGTNAAGDDVYDVKYAHMDKTYVISQPAPDGKIASIWMIEGPAIQSIRHAVVSVTSPEKSAKIIYTRAREYTGSF